mmetsp:Transcript_6462/g.8472  ORF Transcript_6462/g.8472 Transcript_6462/m.8472 type:complete len:104 (-) Transcript_6462:558-869(-)
MNAGKECQTSEWKELNVLAFILFHVINARNEDQSTSQSWQKKNVEVVEFCFSIQQFDHRVFQSHSSCSNSFALQLKTLLPREICATSHLSSSLCCYKTLNGLI